MACLDWREICDGKIDCLNGGQDEQNCFELEVNECEENEFRCYNGAQCIPLGMIDDNKLNPDCLDGTDERLVPAFLWEQCVTDPAFRCEERKCTTQLQNSCGDGACRDGSFLQTSNLFSSDECLNGRDRAILTEVLSRQANPLLSDDCWAVRWCLIPQQACAGHFCPDDSISCGELIRRSCSLPYFVYPALAAELLGNVDLVVKTNISNMHRVELFTFACFKNNLCDGRLPLLTEQIGNWSTCIQLDILKYYFVERSTNWMASLRTLLGICESRDSTALNRTHCRSDHHFHCPNNGKCISKHRLFDGNTDCFDEIDEKVGATCFYVKNSVRVECSRTISSYRNRCLLITDTIDGSFTCLYNQDKTDEIHEKRNQQPPFPLLCDMHANVIALEGNETDETNCMYWPCDNIYTRCDHIWHCSNGTDEAYCGSSICPPATHPCLSPITNELNCLPISRANDGIIDCRGASDERDLCRRQAPFDRKRRYRCWNDTECISVKELCDNYTYLSGIEGEGYQCERFHDDEQFCEDFSAMYMPYGICESYHDMNRTVKQAVLCNLSEELPQAEHYGLSPERPFTLSGRQYTVIPHLSTPSVKYKQNDLRKFGPRCYLTRSSCRRDTCSYHGLCIPMDERVSEQGFICICNEQYFGLRCEHSVLRIDITFSHMSIPTGILLHFIEATGETAHKRITTMKKISFGQEIATVRKNANSVTGGNRKGRQLNQLYNPQGLFIDNDDKSVYIADSDNDRIVQWKLNSNTGQVIAGKNGQGNQSNQLNFPIGLSFDNEENLYVVDRNNDRVQKYEKNLNLK
ncbi:unnamed protein product [Adineta steineri]|uniref:EGF-like domain-containing protein n=1 Tax=Adineta steineri TaxID=433720 RepID=A0A814XGN7_9BILA|nr:unnamed protein product [Adineta steineri]CAF1293380.1 unnamed protein product [Adineta steineri]